MVLSTKILFHAFLSWRANRVPSLLAGIGSEKLSISAVGCEHKSGVGWPDKSGLACKPDALNGSQGYECCGQLA